MHKIDKILKKLSPEERKQITVCIGQIVNGDTNSLDIKKLKGQKYFYRVRIGSLRIIFFKKQEENLIISINRKNDNTYRNL